MPEVKISIEVRAQQATSEDYRKAVHLGAELCNQIIKECNPEVDCTFEIKIVI